MRLRPAVVVASVALGFVMAGTRAARAQDAPTDAGSTPIEAASSATPPQLGVTDEARAALRAGELERALALAHRAVEQRPDDVEALTVLGMVEAERGEPQAALELFDTALARSGSRAAAGLHWNRAACLSALGRSEDAEQAYLEVAARAQAPLDALGLINAGLAALDAAAPARARKHLMRAERRDPEHVLEAELQDLRDQLAAYDDGERERLRQLVARGELDAAEAALEPELSAHPDDAELQYLGGLVAYQRAHDALAERRLRRARQLGLDPERDASARDYLELLAGGLWLSGRGLYLDLELGGGYDSNAVQAGLGQGNPLLSEASSTLGGPYGRMRAELGYGLEPWEHGFAVASYALDQLAYTEGALDLWNAQQHELAVELEQRVNGGMRLFAGARGSFELAGLSDLRPFAAGGGGELGIGLDHDRGLRSRLSAAAHRSELLDADFEFLSATRLELLLQESYARRATRGGIFASYRGELLGTQRVATAAPVRLCTDCSARYVIPLTHHGPRAGLWGSYRLLPGLRAAARVSAELRTYGSAAHLRVTSASGGSTEAGSRRQRDVRLVLGAGLTTDLPDPFEIDVDYDVTISWSNTDNTLGGAHRLDYANRQFVRHVLWLGLAARL